MNYVTIDNSNTGKKIKDIRLHRNLTLEELSQITSISVNVIKSYEYGYRTPSLKNATSIANALNTSLDSFIIYHVNTR